MASPEKIQERSPISNQQIDVGELRKSNRSGKLNGRNIALVVLAIAALVAATIATMGVFGVGIAAVAALPLIAKVTLSIGSGLISAFAIVMLSAKSQVLTERQVYELIAQKVHISEEQMMRMPGSDSDKIHRVDPMALVMDYIFPDGDPDDEDDSLATLGRPPGRDLLPNDEELFRNDPK